MSDTSDSEADIPLAVRMKRLKRHVIIESSDSDDDVPLGVRIRRGSKRAVLETSDSDSEADIPLGVRIQRLKAKGRKAATNTSKHVAKGRKAAKKGRKAAIGKGKKVATKVAGKGNTVAKVTAVAIVPPPTPTARPTVLFKFDHQPRRLQDVATLARALIQQHAPGWGFEFDGATRRAGRAHYSSGVLSVSKLYAESSRVPNHAVRNTILHEIAHAMAGHKAGHGKEWKRQAIAIGCTGNRCHTYDFAPSKYVQRCPCGKCTRQLQMLPKGYRQGRYHPPSCATCGRPLQIFKLS